MSDAKSLSGAARTTDLSPPAVTRAVNGLEVEIGVRLLTRTTRAVNLTPAGTRYVADCRHILSALVDANASVAGLQPTIQGNLTIAAPALFGTQFVTPVVTEFLKLNPMVKAKCWFFDRAFNLVEEGIAVEIRVGDLPELPLAAKPVGRVRRVICAAPA